MDACKHRMTLFTIRRRDAFLFGVDAASREKFKAKGKSRDSGADRQRIQQGDPGLCGCYARRAGGGSGRKTAYIQQVQAIVMLPGRERLVRNNILQ